MYQFEKGKMLKSFPTEFIALDIETTGLSCSIHEIIEVGAVHFKDGSIVDTYQSFIQPTGYIPSFITNLTGITNAMVKDARGVKDVLVELLEYIGDKIIVAHNASFDIGFIYQKCYTNGLEFTNDYVDTLYHARRIVKDLKSKTLSNLVEYYHISHQNTHRAVDDAIACGLLLYQLMEDKRNG